MSRIRGKNTKPELSVRRLLHRMGYRYRLHAKDLPGRPDIVFRSRKSVIFVHGCFWHRHEGCRLAYTPKTRKDFWKQKFARNVERDIEVTSALQSMDWKFLILWECETGDSEKVAEKLSDFLDGDMPQQKSL